MRHRPFTLCSALSMLLCVAVVALWVRSYWRLDVVRLPWATWRDGGGGTWHTAERWVESEGAGLWAFAVVGRGSARWGESPPAPAEWRPGWQARPTSPRRLRDPPPLWFHVRRQSMPRGSVGGPPKPAGYVPPAYTTTSVTVPYWVPFALTAVLPAWWVRGRSRARWRRQRGLCLACGYDLRASTGVCPECGAATAATSPVSALSSVGDPEPDPPPRFLVNELTALLILLPVVPLVLLDRGCGWTIPNERVSESWQSAIAVTSVLGWGVFALCPGRQLIRRALSRGARRRGGSW